MRILSFILLSIFLTKSWPNYAQPFVEIVKQARHSVVGVGLLDPLATPKAKLLGTGFAVGDGSIIATNNHVVEQLPESQGKVSWIVFEGSGRNPKMHLARVIARDKIHDLALLKLAQDKTIPAMNLAPAQWLDDGHDIAFTGFPIGEVLGLYPVTHRGIISAKTPSVIPAGNARELTPERLKLLRDPYLVYQLDATAYPGNSGSPVYLRDTGEVIAIVNKVHVRKGKESILSNPSNITYAIPVAYLHKLLDRLN